MKRLPLLILLIPLCLSMRLSAQESSSLPNPEENLIDRPHAQDWLTDIDPGWLTHEGDDLAWSAPAFDDSHWGTTRIDDLGPAQPGWRWFRRHLKLHVNHPDLFLLLQGGVGTYELYINGARVPGPQLRSSLAVNRPTERVFVVDDPGTDVVLALRTHIPTGYAAWRLPQFMSVYLGTEDAIDVQRQSMFQDRTHFAIPALVINMLIAFAGLALFALYATQRGHLEYFWLGLYFLLVGVGDLLWYTQQSGFIPLAWNVLVGDPFIYAFTIAQIRFTFAFGGHRLESALRVYQLLVLIPIAMTWLVWYGKLPSQVYVLVEPLFILPIAVLLPILLLIWYRRGNREAGWLILPSLFPVATTALYDLGTASIFMGWKRFEFLDNYISVGPVPLEPNDLGNLLFLLSSGIVIFFRFSRVARDQARSAAEFAAAREIQQRLVPAALPASPGYHLEAAYLPAQEVGGDFYQVFDQADGSLFVVVGDVSGKGLKAAMTGALAIGALRTLAAENIGPAELLRLLNRQMFNTQEAGFITCLCVRIDCSGAARIANAGHLSPYCAGIEIPVDPGLPLGLVGEVEYSETSCQLAPGDTMTLISDGVVEATDSTGQLYGFERTRAISTQSAQAIAAAAKSFGQEDDITVLTMARIPVLAAALA